MRFEIKPESFFSLLPAGRRRLELAHDRLGREGDDPSLPKRSVPFVLDEKHRTLYLGPVEDPKGPEEKLWYTDVLLS